MSSILEPDSSSPIYTCSGSSSSRTAPLRPPATSPAGGTCSTAPSTRAAAEPGGGRCRNRPSVPAPAPAARARRSGSSAGMSAVPAAGCAAVETARATAAGCATAPVEGWPIPRAAAAGSDPAERASGGGGRFVGCAGWGSGGLTTAALQGCESCDSTASARDADDTSAGWALCLTITLVAKLRYSMPTVPAAAGGRWDAMRGRNVVLRTR